MKYQEMSLANLHNHFMSGDLTIPGLALDLWNKAQESENRGVFISLIPRNRLLEMAQDLQKEMEENPGIFLQKPLLGIPFAVKDNIDLRGLPTTAGCADFSYEPARSSRVVELLMEAGALPMGKTNMDQFATGLVGTRTPFGIPQNPNNPLFMPGGSSSGSGVAVARDLVSFALGTDTAGSGRVPASVNGIIGYKPTPGLIPKTGVVPACTSIDCVSVFSKSYDDTRTIAQTLWSWDTEDPFSQRTPRVKVEKAPLFPKRLGVPLFSQLDFFGDSEGIDLWQDMIRHWEEQDAEIVPVDFRPFFEAAELLYGGPWVAERWAALGAFVQEMPGSLLDITRGILESGQEYTASEFFQANWELASLKQRINALEGHLDGFLVPTIGRPFTLQEIAADPLGTNNKLGRYTNFMNLLGLCAVALPFRKYSNEMPWGFTLFSFAGYDTALLRWSQTFHNYGHLNRKEIVVVGAHLKGLPLNYQLTERDGQYVRSARTADKYRMVLLDEGSKKKPGLIRTETGTGFPVEVWSIPNDELASFIDLIPSPLGLGKVELSDGSWVTGFICSTDEDFQDISAHGGWSDYLLSTRE